MTNKKKGYIDVKIGGKKRTLHFSMNFWSEFTEQLGVSLQDIGTVFDNGVSLSTLRALIYSAIVANDLEKNNEINYNVYTVGAWLDDIDAEQINAIIETLMQSKILGNSLNDQNKTSGKPKPSKRK